MKNLTTLTITLLLALFSLSISAQTDEPIYYEVQFGNSLKQIAKKYNTSVEQIMEWNGLTGKGIAAGDKLIVGYKGEKKEQVKEETKQKEVTLEDIGTDVEDGKAEVTKDKEPEPVVSEDVETMEVQKGIDKLMFCGSVDDEDPVGVSNIFYMGYGEDYLYGFFRQERDFNVKTIFVRLYELNPASGEYSHLKTTRFKVKPNWSHVYFRYSFEDAGKFLIKVFDPDDVKLVEGRVTIVK